MLLLVAACGNKDAPRPATKQAPAPPVVADAASPPTYPDLGAALTAIIPADTRVIGFGELHSRTDSAQVTSSLAHFTAEGLPALEDKLSDLIIETWITDPHCGSAATEATAKVTGRKAVVDHALLESFKNGSARRLYYKWFTMPVPPNSANANLPMSDAVNELFIHPNDNGV